jgi:lysophospholipase L1-like esterase
VFLLENETTYSAATGHGFDRGTTPGDGRTPFFFSVAVPEGNWQVDVTLGGATSGETSVKAESRRLMIETLSTPAGTSVVRRFIVNVRQPSLPADAGNPSPGNVALEEREKDSLTWDDKLTLEFSGPAPRVRSITLELVAMPTVFLLGDSTVTDQRGEDYASWGQMLPRFFRPDIAVANHAESGESLKSFVAELRLAKVLSQVRAGDWVFVQFGHNDQKKQWPQTYVEAGTTYDAWLRTYLAEIRRRGATPVMVTSPQRRTFSPEGKIRNTHGDYPAAVRAVAATERVALIDLEAASRALYEALGPERALLAFARDGQDATHHNDYGAYELAKAVAQGIRDARLPLAQFLADDFTGYDPAHPDDPAGFSVSAGTAVIAERPAGD